MRGIFFGTSEFAVPALRTFAATTDCVLVITLPDRPAGRGHVLTPTPVKRAAAELGIATLEPTRLRDAVPSLAALAADLFAVAAYGKIVPQAVLDLAPLGALNVHPSLLPLYRGATPLQSALRDGVTESGVSIIFMDAGMDTGDVVLVERTPVSPTETYGELHDRYSELGARLLGTAAGLVKAGAVPRVEQANMGIPEERIVATATRPLGKAEMFVDWGGSASTIANLVRSLAPQPLARFEIAGIGTVKIARAHEVNPNEASSGSWLVRCGGGGIVALDLVVKPNRGPMTGAAFRASSGAAVAAIERGAERAER